MVLCQAHCTFPTVSSASAYNYHLCVSLWCVCLLGAYRCRFMMYGIILNLSVAIPSYALGVKL